MIERLRGLYGDTRGVSPAVGVIILVGMGVVLAMIVGVFAFGLSSFANDPAPSAKIDFTSNNGNITITHNGGDVISKSNTGQLEVRISGSAQGTIDGNEWVSSGVSVSPSEPDKAVVTGTITAGDVIWDSSSGAAAGQFSNGDTIEIVWLSEDTDSTFVLAEYTA